MRYFVVFKSANTWEQRELGEVTEDFVEKSTVENQYPVLTSSQQKGIVLQDDYFAGDRVSQSGNLGYFIIPRGYFAYRSRSDNDVFVFNRNDCVDMGIISYFYPVFKPKNVDSDFLLRRLNNGLETQLRISSEGTGQHVLSLKKFKNMTTLFPTISEQQKIGAYFKSLDNLITLHQRSYNLEQKSKTTNAWEQRELGEIATEIVAGGDIDKDLILDEGRYPVIANALTNDGIVGYYNEDYRIKAPAVTITGRGDVGHAKARIVDFTPVVRLLSLKSNHDVFFLENAINTLKIVIESTGVPQLTVPQVAKYEISFPKSLDEEEKIGVYFNRLDNLITLHQREHCLSIKA